MKNRLLINSTNNAKRHINEKGNILLVVANLHTDIDSFCLVSEILSLKNLVHEQQQCIKSLETLNKMLNNNLIDI